LYLGVNQLSGNVPESIVNCTSLDSVTFNQNQLNGDLPSNFGSNQIFMRYLDFGCNRLSGEIPEGLYMAKNLVYVNLAGNNFSSLPGWLNSNPQGSGYLKNLEVFNFSCNPLTSFPQWCDTALRGAVVPAWASCVPCSNGLEGEQCLVSLGTGVLLTNSGSYSSKNHLESGSGYIVRPPSSGSILQSWLSYFL